MTTFFKLCIPVLFTGYQLLAQEIPQKFIVPPVSPDPNQNFAMLHFEAIDKGKFSILYFQTIYASVATTGEFIADTGSAVYVDNKRRDMVYNSGQATLLVKQIIEADGKANTEQIWLLANRKMESVGEYRLYLRKNFNHPIIKSNVPINLTVHNLDAVKGLSDGEYNALVTQVNKMFPPQQEGYKQAAYKKPSIAEDIASTKNQFKELRAAGHMMRGDLPKGESVLTRYTITSERNIVVTKIKGETSLLKFYITTDFKSFDLVDSSRVEGSIDMSSVGTIYDRDGRPIGAVVNFLNKIKDEKGETVLKLITYSLDRNYEITGWKHALGKNKLNSFVPEVCWYNGDKLMVLSTNNEKVFKPYYQFHEFAKGKDAALLYPLTDEEKGSEKNIYAKSFQPERPINSSLPPTAEKKVPLGFYSVGGSQYIFTQGQRRDPATNTTQYLALDIIRINPENKLTNIDMYQGYVSSVPVPIVTLAENLDQHFFIVSYMNKLQVKFEKDKSEITPVNSTSEILDFKMDGEFAVKNSFGSTLIKRSANGTNRTLYFYPDIK